MTTEKCRCGRKAEFAVIGEDSPMCAHCAPNDDLILTPHQPDFLEMTAVRSGVEGVIGRLPGWASEERGEAITRATSNIMTHRAGDNLK